MTYQERIQFSLEKRPSSSPSRIPAAHLPELLAQDSDTATEQTTSPGGTRIYLRNARGKNKSKPLTGQVGREAQTEWVCFK